MIFSCVRSCKDAHGSMPNFNLLHRDVNVRRRILSYGLARKITRWGYLELQMAVLEAIQIWVILIPCDTWSQEVFRLSWGNPVRKLDPSQTRHCSMTDRFLGNLKMIHLRTLHQRPWSLYEALKRPGIEWQNIYIYVYLCVYIYICMYVCM